LRGTRHGDAAQQLVTFLTGETFQRTLPLTLFVYPVNGTVRLPEVFTKFAAVPANPYSMDPVRIAQHRQSWQEQWTQTVID